VSLPSTQFTSTCIEHIIKDKLSARFHLHFVQIYFQSTGFALENKTVKTSNQLGTFTVLLLVSCFLLNFIIQTN